MSEPLKKLIVFTPEYRKRLDIPEWEQVIEDRLNAAIDRINELEAENIELRNLWSQSEDREMVLKVRLGDLARAIVELEAKYEGHKHGYLGYDSVMRQPMPNDMTTPPTEATDVQ